MDLFKAILFVAIKVLLNSLPKEEVKQEKKCPNCGQTMKEIVISGRLGCPECYNFFRNVVKTCILKVQDGNTKHYGKTPKRLLN